MPRRQTVLRMAEETHHEDLSLFRPMTTEVGTEKTEWITHRPTNQLTEGSAIEFSIPGTSTTFVDLKSTLLHLKLKIVKADGSPVTSDLVGLANAPLHTIFSQVDLNIQQHPVSEVGTNYTYKGYLDTLLNEIDERNLNCQLFVKDNAGSMEDASPNGGNKGLLGRANYTIGGKEAELIGSLALDLCQQDRLLLNGVPLNLKLWQNADSFRLMTELEEKYKVVITDAQLKVAVVKVNPSVIVSQANVLKEKSALYPYTRSIIKTYAVPTGQYSFITDDLFQGQVPKRLLVGIVSSAAANGDYTKNPFNFRHYHCNYAGFFVDGQSTPSCPLQPNFESGSFVEAYQRLYPDNRQRALTIDRYDFRSGYCLFAFNPDGDVRDRLRQSGHTRLELKFAKPLPETCTVIVYGQFPALMKIDASRNVSLE